MTEEKLKQFRDDVRKDAENLEFQTEISNEALRFVDVPGGQWEGEFGQRYGEDRAKMQFDVTSDHIKDFVSEWNQNRVGVEYKPDDSATTDEDAELLNGLYRADYTNNDGKMSVDQAVDEIAKCGYGCFRIGTVFEDEEDPENDDQKITFFPIVNAYNHVIWDRNSKRIDKKDANHCTLLTEVEVEKFEEEHPDVRPTSAYTPQQWSYDHTGHKPATVFIATRYEVIVKREKVFKYNNLETGEIETYSKEAHEEEEARLKKSDVHEFVRERTIKRRTIEVSKFTGDQFIEEPRRIAGKWIPIIPGYAYRSFVDGKEYYHGLVLKKMDGQRLYNSLMNKVAEDAFTGGARVPIFTPKQMQNPSIQNAWADKNNQAYLLAEIEYDDNGNAIATGPVGYSEPSTLDQNTGVLLDQTLSFMQRGKGPKEEVFDRDMSGKAIDKLIKRLNMATQDIHDNLKNMVAHAGLVYKDMVPDVYDSPRDLNTQSREGTEGKARLFETRFNRETEQIETVNKLSTKKFRVYSDVGPQYETLREQTVEELRALLAELNKTPAGQEYVSAVIPIILANVSGEGLEPIKILARQNQLLQGLVKPQNEEEEEFLAQAQQPQQDATQDLIAATAEKERAEASNLEASSIDKIASANKKAAETEQIQTETESKQLSNVVSIREQVFRQASAL